MQIEEKSCVQGIVLSTEVDRRVALATVRIGEASIRGVAVWKSPHGKLRVFFPSYKVGHGFEEAICLPEDLRSEIEADVIAAYKSAKARAKEASVSQEKEF